jgi:replicative DNA helicase
MSKKQPKSNIPQALESEKTILACLLGEPQRHWPVVLSFKLQAEDFCSDEHRAIFRTAHKFYVRKEPCDFAALQDYLVGQLKQGEKPFPLGLAKSI